MNKCIGFWILFVVSGILVQGVAAGKEYKTVTGISYYGKPSEGYMKERCLLDFYYPANDSGFTTVIWFHGGGLTGGKKFIPDKLKGKGIAVVAVNYRLSPQAQNPAWLEDAAAAIAWTFRNISDYGGSDKRIVVAGHSAGAYLALMTGLDKKWLGMHGIDANRIAAIVPFSGHTITHMTVRKERGIPDTRPVVDEFAPLYHVRPDGPPLYLITGDRELEMLGRYEENAYLWRMMKVAGHPNTFLYELDGFNHGGMAGPACDSLLQIVEKIVLPERKN